MKEIVFYGGTYDPPTDAHQEIIKRCLATKDIDEVWVVPSGDRTDKPDMIALHHRMNMLLILKKVAFNDDERLKVSEFEARLPQPTETQLTISALKKTYPHDNFWFVFGADSYHDMPNWRGGTDLQRRLGVLVVPRAGYKTPPVSGNLKHLEISPDGMVNVSSTALRSAIHVGNERPKYINPEVLQYILNNNLYQ